MSVSEQAASQTFLPTKRKRAERLKTLVPGLIASGHTVSEISNTLNVHYATAKNWCEELIAKYPELQELEKYEENRADIISAIEAKSLKSIQDKLNSPNVHLKDATLSFKVLHQASRLERGLSTSNQAIKADISFTAINPAHISDSDDD